MVQTPISPQLLYPDSDGQPMAENTLQYRWIVRLVTNLKHLLKDRTAFVAGDLLWYPVPVTEPPAPCQAPDAMVVLGRPPGDRGSYKQWQEENVAPQVVFEIISPSNTIKEMTAKQMFYEKYGVLEMFFYQPETQNFWGFARQKVDESFVLITPLHLPWISPTLQIRFELLEDGLEIFYPDGEPFKEPETIFRERDAARQAEVEARSERDAARQAKVEAQAERDAARQAEVEAQAERDAARQAEVEAQAQLDRALAKLRELGIDSTQLES